MDEELLQDIKFILESIEKQGRTFEKNSTATSFMAMLERMNDNLERMNSNLETIQLKQNRMDTTLTLLYDKFRQS